jgi:hypothetical protein
LLHHFLSPSTVLLSLIGRITEFLTSGFLINHIPPASDNPISPALQKQFPFMYSQKRFSQATLPNIK